MAGGCGTVILQMNFQRPWYQNKHTMLLMKYSKRVTLCNFLTNQFQKMVIPVLCNLQRHPEAPRQWSKCIHSIYFNVGHVSAKSQDKRKMSHTDRKQWNVASRHSMDSNEKCQAGGIKETTYHFLTWRTLLATVTVIGKWTFVINAQLQDLI